MRTRRISYENHVIEFMQPSLFEHGSVFEEIVLYDGKEKCRGSTLTGGKYTFVVEENAHPVEYKLTYNVPWIGLGKGMLTVERDGVTIYRET